MPAGCLGENSTYNANYNYTSKLLALRHALFFPPRSFEESFNTLCPEKPWVTRLSSAGLVYLHFGRQIISHLTHLAQGSRELEILYDKVSFCKKRTMCSVKYFNFVLHHKRIPKKGLNAFFLFLELSVECHHYLAA